MVALWNKADRYIFILWFLWSPSRIGQTSIFLSCGFFLLFFLAWSQPSEIGCLPYFHTWYGLSANLGCRSEMCCKWLAGNARPKKPPKMRHLLTIAQLCRAISSQLRHVSTIGKKFVKQQYDLQISAQYGELRPSSGWDLLASLRHTCKVQRVSRLGSVVAW